MNIFRTSFVPHLVLGLQFGMGMDALAEEKPPTFCLLEANANAKPTDYIWTSDHLQVGVRWQPFAGKPKLNAADSQRPVLKHDSSYAQFWASWNAIEPTPTHTNYVAHPSASLQALEQAVNFCQREGIKVEFVFFHCPSWASESGKSGGYKPKIGLFKGYARRMAAHFKGRVHAWQLSHEANLEGLMRGADMDFVLSEILTDGARAIREVYAADPVMPVLVSTTGMSPCQNCNTREGLKGTGGWAVSQFYDQVIARKDLMQQIDAINLNVSDNSDGYGCMDGSYVPSVWGNYELARRKLDAAGYRSKSVRASESWIVWDDANMAVDVNGDGVKNEVDAYEKAITIIGQCLQRGLNTINLPWSDNSSAWAMGLTKRRDYSGRIKQLNPNIVIPASDEGADIVTRKLALPGGDDNFVLKDGAGHNYSHEAYINPSDPNHLHYYIWKWYAQIAGGPDEVIRHAVAGEVGNDISVTGPGFTGHERYRLASFNRTRQRFVVLLYASGANGTSSAKVKIPSRIQTGRHYNNEFSKIDFRGEGFENGIRYQARIITKDISPASGADLHARTMESEATPVADETLEITISDIQRFTTIEFMRLPDHVHEKQP